MESNGKIKRNYTKRTQEERLGLLKAQIERLKLAHLKREALIERLEIRHEQKLGRLIDG